MTTRVIDQISRYPEVEITNSTAAQQIIELLTKIFLTHGIPFKVITDKSPPFPNHKFKDFMTVNGIKHHRITPLHPKKNAVVENFMRNLNKRLRTAQIEQTMYDPQQQSKPTKNVP
ncbi:uncharacterized protein K02A2.6-like [Hydractinia symbiolongicarpus]|uniref:uncharacterized protein K02A2.6-like n=1 Tax=Hydractinia symbiolongicarpus TaxID=13093 RepID=UPI0025504736|nr:uncharacterized protein K02A2.6-like [Hydractinia symbiolongicarpus]